MQLDDLARTARADLAHSVASMRTPPPASPRARRAASVVSLLVLIAVLVGLLVARNGHDREQGFVDPRAPLYFVLDTEGTSWRPITVTDTMTMANPVYLTAFFGDAGADDPFAVNDAQVGVATEDLLTAAEPVNVTVNGEPGRSWTGRVGPDGAEARTIIFPSGGRAVLVISLHLDEPSLIEFAEALRVEGDDVALDRPVRGMARIGPTLRSDDQRSVTYRNVGDVSSSERGSQMIDVATRIGSADMLRQLRWSGARPTEVDGRPAMLTQRGESGGVPALNLTWLAADGVILSINSARSEAELRSLVGRVRQVSEAEWASLREAASAELLGTAKPPVTGATATSIATDRQMISGRDDGVDWTYAQSGPANWCLTVPIANERSSSCMGRRSTEPWIGVDWLQRVVAVPANGRNLSMLTTTADIVGLSVVRPDGVRIEYHLLPNSLGDGFPLFFASAPEVAALPTDPAGSKVQLTATFRDGTTTTTPLSIPELFRRTP